MTKTLLLIMAILSLNLFANEIETREESLTKELNEIFTTVEDGELSSVRVASETSILNDVQQTLMGLQNLEFSKRNNCYDLGMINGNLEFLHGSAEDMQAYRRYIRRVRKSLKKFKHALKDCQEPYIPFFLQLFLLRGPNYSVNKRDKTQRKVERKVERIEKLKNSPNSMFYNLTDLKTKISDILKDAQTAEVEPYKCFLLGSASAKARIIADTYGDEGLAEKLRGAANDLASSCGVNMKERYYERKINRLLDVLNRL
jgi:hypothetical protein